MARSLLRLSPLCLVLVAHAAAAQNPNWPNPDPATPPSALKDPANWPGDPGYGGSWNLWSFVPDEVAAVPGFRQEELAMGIGMHADRAWLLSTGDFSVTIAVHDSGFRWHERDLVNKWKLNQGELPKPQRADGSEFPDWDANGDGRFNVQDYTSAVGHGQPDAGTIVDPRLTDWNANGILDPQDLIHHFSDGTDADASGYVDDICGWDFLWDDNDPYDDVGTGGEGYSHGTGEAKDSAGEGNNGIGDIGICPDCSLLPIRAADSFVGEIDAFAAGVIFSVDHGASVIQEALGTINNAPLAQAAIDYAYDRGVVIVASAADETSYHHNYPGSLERTLYVHAIVFDKDDWRTSTTFLNFNNCTNYGGHLVLSTPGTGCSSEATGKTAGHAGLIYSMAKQRGLTLTTAEILQIFWMAADDIDVAGSATDSTKFPSGPGWDHHFGYGRNNVRSSLDLIDSGAIPPELDITAPRWFETVEPGSQLVFEGNIAAPRAGSFDYVVEVAPGVTPAEADFRQVKSEDGRSTAIVNGALGTVDTATLFANATEPPIQDAHQFAATVRIRAVAHYGGAIGDAPATFRKTFFVHRDPDLHPGFPLWLGGGGGEPSARLADLDGDGKDELVLATTDGHVHVLNERAEERAGFPVRLGDIPFVAAHAGSPGFSAAGVGSDWAEPVLATASIGDVDGDGQPEIVVATLAGRVHVIGADGTLERTLELDRTLLDCGFELASNPGACRYTGLKKLSESDDTITWEQRVLHPGFFAAPVLADYTGDGALDIVQAGMDGVLYVWNGKTGEDVPGFPIRVHDPRPTTGSNRDGKRSLITVRAELLGTPAVADLDGDGKPELALGSNEVYGDADSKGRFYLLKGTGASSVEDPESAWWPGYPIEVRGLTLAVLPFVGRGTPGNPVFADLDGDGTLELGAHAIAAQGNFYRTDGFDYSSPRIDLRTGEAFLGTGDNADPGALATSDDVPLWIPVNSGSVGDLDGDGLLDYVDGAIGSTVIFGAGGGVRGDFDHQLVAWEMGRAMKNTDLSRDKFQAPFFPGFPQKVDDYMFFMNYAIGDVDGDQVPEVISGTGGYRITAFNHQGEQPAGWPKHTGGWVVATAALGDLDGDGFTDVVVPTRDGWLYAWRTTGKASTIQWEGFHHDAKATGNFHEPLPTRREPGQDGIDPGADGGEAVLDDGGCCSVAGRTSGLTGSAGLLLGLALLRARRRRG